MDPNLIQRVVDYHGNELLDLLESDQTLSSIPIPSAIEYRPPEGDPNDEEFRRKLNYFLSRKSDLLYTPSLPPVVEIVKNEKAVEDYYAVMPPLEAFMGISPSQCRKHFYQCAQKNDIFVGVVTAVQESGLIITLLALDYGKARDIDQLRITGFCPLREVPRLYAHESPLDAFTIKDKVRGIILQVDPDKEKIVVSLQVSALPPGVENLKIGLIADEEMPIHYQRLTKSSGKPYEEMLTSELGFSNPNCVSFLCSVLGLSDETPPSLMRGLNRLQIPEAETAEGLRKIQTTKWALKSVAAGISHFKDGRYVEAVQHFNKALEIDPENVEAFVARGALFANNENYSKAIADFEKALELNPRHQNARKYLCETLVVHGRITEDQGDKDLAMQFFERALVLKPDLIEARDCIRHLKREEEYLRQQDIEQRHQSYPDDEVIDLRSSSPVRDPMARNPEKPVFKETADTLRKLIEEDREHGRLKKKKKKRSRSGEKYYYPEQRRKDHQVRHPERRQSRETYSETNVERQGYEEKRQMDTKGVFDEYGKKRSRDENDEADFRDRKRRKSYREERDTHLHDPNMGNLFRDSSGQGHDSRGQGHDSVTLATRLITIHSQRQKYGPGGESDHTPNYIKRDSRGEKNHFDQHGNVDSKPRHGGEGQHYFPDTKAYVDEDAQYHRHGERRDVSGGISGHASERSLTHLLVGEEKWKQKQEQGYSKERGKMRQRSRSRSASPYVHHHGREYNEVRDVNDQAETRSVTVTSYLKKSRSHRGGSRSPRGDMLTQHGQSDAYGSYPEEDFGKGHDKREGHRSRSLEEEDDFHTYQHTKKMHNEDTETKYKPNDRPRNPSFEKNSSGSKSKSRYSDQDVYRKTPLKGTWDREHTSLKEYQSKYQKKDYGEERSPSDSRSRSSSKSAHKHGVSTSSSKSRPETRQKLGKRYRSSSSSSRSSRSSASDTSSSGSRLDTKSARKITAKDDGNQKSKSPTERNQRKELHDQDKREPQLEKDNRGQHIQGPKPKKSSSFMPRSLLVKNKPPKKSAVKPKFKPGKNGDTETGDKDVGPVDPRKSRWDSPSSEEEEKTKTKGGPQEPKESLEDLEKFLHYLKTQKKEKDSAKK